LPRFPHPSARPAHKPLGSALPVAPPDEVASCPASCILRLCRRPSFELPRFSRPSAHPLVKLRSPRTSLLRLRLPMHPSGLPRYSAPSGLAGDRSSSRPESPILQHIWRSSLGFPPQPRSSSCACRCISRVAPASASSGCVGDGASSCLASRVLRRFWR